MKKMIYIQILLFFFAGSTAFSQDEALYRLRAFGLNASVMHSQVSEALVNGLVHGGAGFSVAAFYSSYNRNIWQRLELSAGLDLLSTRFESEPQSFLIQTSLRYVLDRRITERNNPFTLYLGGQAKLLADQGIYINWDENHYYWVTGYSIGFNSMARFRISEKRALSFEFGLPLVSIVARNPGTERYHEANPEFLKIVKQIHRDPTIEFPGTYFNPEIKLAFHISTGKKPEHILFYRFDYLANDIPGSMKMKNIHHALGYEFKF